MLSQTVRKKTVPDLVPGDDVRLFIEGRVTSWRVAGIVEEQGGDNVYVTAEGLAAAQGRPQQVDRLRVQTGGHDERTRDTVAAAVRTALADAGIAVRSAASVSRAEAVGEGHMGPLLLVLLGIAVPLGVLGVIGLASTMSANVLDRTREFGIMHAIGARPRTVRRIVAAEGLLLAFAGCVAAVVAGGRAHLAAGRRAGQPVHERARAVPDLGPRGGDLGRARTPRRGAGHRRRRHPRLPPHRPGGPRPPVRSVVAGDARHDRPRGGRSPRPLAHAISAVEG